LFLGIQSINYSLKSQEIEKELSFQKPLQKDYSSRENYLANAIAALNLPLKNVKELLLHFSSNFFHGTNTIANPD